MSQENVEIVRRSIEAFQRGLEDGDPGGAAFDTGVFADDSEWVLAPESFGEVPVYRGRDGFKEFFRDFTEDLAEWSISLERLIEAGDDLVVATLRQRATGKASGVPVEWQMGVVYELEGGRVIRMTNYDSEAEALEAAGLSE